jgi:outer membrane protein assembly factor BamB
VTAPEGSAVKNLILQASKAQLIWIVNRDDMSGQGEPGFVGGEVLTFNEPLEQLYFMRNNLTTWTNPEDGSVWVYSVNGTGGMVAFQIQVGTDGMPFLEPTWINEYRGTSPIVANGILYYANSNILRALNPATGEQYWESRDVGEMHWQSLIVVNGMVYVADRNQQFHAYSLDGRPETTGASHRLTGSS